MLKIISTLSTALILLFLLITRPALAQSTPGDILFFDDFSTNLNSWVIENGNWQIQNGQLVGSGYGRALGGRTTTSNYEWDNYIYEIDVLNENGIDEGIGFRRADNGDNSYEVIVRHGIGNYNTPEIILAKVENQQLKILFDTHNVPLVNNVTYHFKFSAENEHLQGWVNDTLIYDLVDSGTKVKKGPISLSYNSGDFGTAVVHFDNVKVTSLNPPSSPIPTATPTPQPKIPLIFIPGIAGSELKVAENTNWSNDNGHGGVYSNNYKKDEKVWVNELEAIKPGNDDYFDVAKLNSDGKTGQANIIPTEEIVGRAYQKTLDYFISQGYTLNQDLFVFGYDWRKDLTETTSDLDSKIEQIKQKTNTTKVNVATHSMGGLLAKNYIQNSQKAQNIHKLITIAPPFLGSVKMAKSLIYGDCINPLPVNTGLLCLGLSGSEVKDLLQNFPSAYELIPTSKYYFFYDGSSPTSPMAFSDERDIDGNNIKGNLNYIQTKQLLTNLGFNTPLYSPAETFHTIDNNLSETNGVDTTIIVGSGKATLGQIVEKYKFNFGGIKIPTKDTIMINGDSTVPLFSASLNDPSRSLSLFDPNKVFYSNDTHGSITTNKSVLDFIQNILKNSSALPNGILKTPFQLKGKLYSVHSPVNINAYDTQGNHTGPTPDGGFEINIPGSSYETIDDAKFIFLPGEEGIYQLKLEATDQGSFDFKARTFDQDKTTKTEVYKDIPLTKETKGEVFIDNNSSASPILNIDEDGDGTSDLTFTQPTESISGNAAADQIPPKTTIKLTGSKGLNNWFTSDVNINLSAEDEPDGSGIAQILYSLDEGQTINIYNSPFSISEEGIKKLRVKAIDNAGNEEPLQEMELKIDKTSPEAKIIFNLTTQDFDFIGMDDLTNTKLTDTGNLVTLTDEAGNKTSLTLTSKERPRKEKISLKSITYNNQKPANLIENLISVTYKLDKNKNVIDLTQRIIIKGDEHLNSNYEPKTDKTKINLKKPKNKKITDEKNGKILLYITTKLGELEANY